MKPRAAGTRCAALSLVRGTLAVPAEADACSEMKRASLLFALLLIAAALVAGWASAGSSAVAGPWTGTWSRPASEFGGAAAGVTTLTQNGSKVTGSYDWHGGGTISGTASGSTLQGTWSEAKGSGTFHLTLTANALSFSGTTEGTAGVFKGLSGSWTGTNIGTRPAPVAAPVAADTIVWPALPDATVSLASVSNGCGGGAAGNDPKYGDDSEFVDSEIPFADAASWQRGKKYHVSFREACKQHDAGYSGAKVRDMTLNGGKVIDYFTWTKAAIDDKFLADMRKICYDQIPKTATVALTNCKQNGGFHLVSGAKTRYHIVDKGGFLFWKGRPRLGGSWAPSGIAGATPWQLSQHTRQITITWSGGAGQPNLRGEFRGTLISHDDDTTVAGFYIITGIGTPRKPAAMKLSWKPKIPNELRVSIPGGTFTLAR